MDAEVSSQELSIPSISPSRTFSIVQAGRRSDTLSLAAHQNPMARLHSPEYRAALAIAQRLREFGYAAYFAGGCVRDLLLGRTPDVVQSAFARTEAVGAHFGVILVLDEIDDRRIATEVATFRSDGAYSDGRRPDAVRFSSDPEEDVQRRDFTINGLLVDPLAFERGDPLPNCIFDVVGGQEDLKAGIIRAIREPSLRFAEDK